MHCPFCGHAETKVIDSRLTAEGREVRRRRQCEQCRERFTTFESAELVMPGIVKRDDTREPFAEAKLRSSLERALQKRPVSAEDIDAAVAKIAHRLRTTGEREVSARLIGEFVMEELRRLDDVAYVRFASVYRNFSDVRDFEDFVADLARTVSERQGHRDDADGPEAGAARL